MNSIDCDLNSTEMEIHTLGYADVDSVSNNSTHTNLVALYNNLLLFKDNDVKWAQRA